MEREFENVMLGEMGGQSAGLKVKIILSSSSTLPGDVPTPLSSVQSWFLSFEGIKHAFMDIHCL